MVDATVDVIVVGAGLIGMLTARALQQHGARVLILERGKAGGESTWAGGGILSPLYPWRYPEAVNWLAHHGQKIYPQMAEEIFAESGVDPEYIRSGMLILDQHENDAADAWARHWQMQMEMLRGDALQMQEPALDPGVSSALWLPQIAQLRNPRLIKSLAGSLRQRKISCMENTEVMALEIESGEVRGVRTAQARYSAGNVVIAGGAWSAKIIQPYAKPPRIQPVKGQMILFRGEPGMLRSIILSQGRYLIPRRDGRILAGSTLEYTAFDKSVHDSALQDLRSAAVSLAPQLAGLAVENHWAGLRPGSEQGVPYICRHPEIKGLYINSGHFRNGVILGAASAQLMADLIGGITPAIDPAFYDFEAAH
ncbi:MAG: glycine oxidase [Pseudomonadota bacterium]|nr:glycine oxidase [Pseudomonadota bacterium]